MKGRGRPPNISLKIASNFGTMKSIRKVTMPTAMVNTTSGYTIAEVTLPLILWLFSANSASRVNTTSSTPPNSPAFTMFTYNLLKALGCCERASEKVVPPSTDSASPVMIFFKLGFFSCFPKVRRLRNRGRPALIRVESWRVKIVRTLAGTLPVPPPPPIEKLSENPFFFPLPEASAVVSAMLVGNCPFFLTAAAASEALFASRVP